jgi:uncharacterized protein YggE
MQLRSVTRNLPMISVLDPRSYTALLAIPWLLAALLTATHVQAQNEPRPRTVTVSGQGEVQAEPDRALLTLGIQARRLKLETARSEVNKKVEAVLQLTRDLKIEAPRVRSTRVNIQPEYSYENNSRKLLGYLVSRQIEVDLRNLELLGELLERAADLGVNQLGEPRLDSSRRQELEREALTKAVADARLNAEALVKAAGGRIGPVRSMSASSNSVAPPMPFAQVRAMAAEAGDAAQSYQSGQMNFAGSVQIEYDLLVDAGR